MDLRWRVDPIRGLRSNTTREEEEFVPFGRRFFSTSLLLGITLGAGAYARRQSRIRDKLRGPIELNSIIRETTQSRTAYKWQAQEEAIERLQIMERYRREAVRSNSFISRPRQRGAPSLPIASVRTRKTDLRKMQRIQNAWQQKLSSTQGTRDLQVVLNTAADVSGRGNIQVLSNGKVLVEAGVPLLDATNSTYINGRKYVHGGRAWIDGDTLTHATYEDMLTNVFNKQELVEKLRRASSTRNIDDIAGAKAWLESSIMEINSGLVDVEGMGLITETEHMHRAVIKEYQDAITKKGPAKQLARLRQQLNELQSKLGTDTLHRQDAIAIENRIETVKRNISKQAQYSSDRASFEVADAMSQIYGKPYKVTVDVGAYRLRGQSNKRILIDILKANGLSRHEIMSELNRHKTDKQIKDAVENITILDSKSQNRIHLSPQEAKLQAGKVHIGRNIFNFPGLDAGHTTPNVARGKGSFYDPRLAKLGLSPKEQAALMYGVNTSAWLEETASKAMASGKKDAIHIELAHYGQYQSLSEGVSAWIDSGTKSNQKLMQELGWGQSRHIGVNITDVKSISNQVDKVRVAGKPITIKANDIVYYNNEGRSVKLKEIMKNVNEIQATDVWVQNNKLMIEGTHDMDFKDQMKRLNKELVKKVKDVNTIVQDKTMASFLKMNDVNSVFFLKRLQRSDVVSDVMYTISTMYGRMLDIESNGAIKKFSAQDQTILKNILSEVGGVKPADIDKIVWDPSKKIASFTMNETSLYKTFPTFTGNRLFDKVVPGQQNQSTLNANTLRQIDAAFKQRFGDVVPEGLDLQFAMTERELSTKLAKAQQLVGEGHINAQKIAALSGRFITTVDKKITAATLWIREGLVPTSPDELLTRSKSRQMGIGGNRDGIKIDIHQMIAAQFEGATEMTAALQTLTAYSRPYVEGYERAYHHLLKIRDGVADIDIGGKTYVTISDIQAKIDNEFSFLKPSYVRDRLNKQIQMSPNLLSDMLSNNEGVIKTYAMKKLGLIEEQAEQYVEDYINRLAGGSAEDAYRLMATTMMTEDDYKKFLAFVNQAKGKGVTLRLEDKSIAGLIIGDKPVTVTELLLPEMDDFRDVVKLTQMVGGKPQNMIYAPQMAPLVRLMQSLVDDESNIGERLKNVERYRDALSRTLFGKHGIESQLGFKVKAFGFRNIVSKPLEGGIEGALKIMQDGKWVPVHKMHAGIEAMDISAFKDLLNTVVPATSLDNPKNYLSDEGMKLFNRQKANIKVQLNEASDKLLDLDLLEMEGKDYKIVRSKMRGLKGSDLTEMPDSIQKQVKKLYTQMKNTNDSYNTVVKQQAFVEAFAEDVYQGRQAYTAMAHRPPIIGQSSQSMNKIALYDVTKHVDELRTKGYTEGAIRDVKDRIFHHELTAAVMKSDFDRDVVNIILNMASNTGLADTVSNDKLYASMVRDYLVESKLITGAPSDLGPTRISPMKELSYSFYGMKSGRVGRVIAKELDSVGQVKTYDPGDILKALNNVYGEGVYSEDVAHEIAARMRTQAVSTQTVEDHVKHWLTTTNRDPNDGKAVKKIMNDIVSVMEEGKSISQLKDKSVVVDWKAITNKELTELVTEITGKSGQSVDKVISQLSASVMGITEDNAYRAISDTAVTEAHKKLTSGFEDLWAKAHTMQEYVLRAKAEQALEPFTVKLLTPGVFSHAHLYQSIASNMNMNPGIWRNMREFLSEGLQQEIISGKHSKPVAAFDMVYQLKQLGNADPDIAKSAADIIRKGNFEIVTRKGDKRLYEAAGLLIGKDDTIRIADAMQVVKFKEKALEVMGEGGSIHEQRSSILNAVTDLADAQKDANIFVKDTVVDDVLNYMDRRFGAESIKAKQGELQRATNNFKSVNDFRRDLKAMIGLGIGDDIRADKVIEELTQVARAGATKEAQRRYKVLFSMHGQDVTTFEGFKSHMEHIEGTTRVPSALDTQQAGLSKRKAPETIAYQAGETATSGTGRLLARRSFMDNLAEELVSGFRRRLSIDPNTANRRIGSGRKAIMTALGAWFAVDVIYSMFTGKTAVADVDPGRNISYYDKTSKRMDEKGYYYRIPKVPHADTVMFNETWPTRTARISMNSGIGTLRRSRANDERREYNKEFLNGRPLSFQKVA